MKKQRSLFWFGILFSALSGCGSKANPPPPQQLTATWGDASGSFHSQSISLEPSAGNSTLYSTPTPIQVQTPIQGSGSFVIELPNYTLPTRDFSRLNVDFQEDQAGGKILGTGISTPLMQDAFEQNGSDAQIHFDLDWLEDSVDEVKAGNHFIMHVWLGSGNPADKSRPLEVDVEIDFI